MRDRSSELVETRGRSFTYTLIDILIPSVTRAREGRSKIVVQTREYLTPSSSLPRVDYTEYGDSAVVTPGVSHAVMNHGKTAPDIVQIRQSISQMCIHLCPVRPSKKVAIPPGMSLLRMHTPPQTIRTNQGDGPNHQQRLRRLMNQT